MSAFAANSETFAIYLQYNSATNGFYVGSPSADAMAFSASSGAERMRIDSSGNVGIGTSAPNERMVVAGGCLQVTGSLTSLNRPSSSVFDFTGGATRIFSIGADSATHGVITFSTATTTTNLERARIDSSGNFLVGKTSYGFVTGAGCQLGASGVAIFTGSNDSPLYLNRTSSDGFIAALYKDGSNVGSISVTATATAYNTSSDYRLKENVRPLAGALERVMQLKPSEWDWKEDGSQGVGFIAHEVQDLRPQAVTGTKDALDKDGKPQYQGMDASFLIADLTAALQDAIKRIEQLESQINSGV